MQRVDREDLRRYLITTEVAGLGALTCSLPKGFDASALRAYALTHDDPARVLCTFVEQASDCGVIEQAVGNLPLPRPTPFPGDPSSKPRVVEPIDRSLGGLVEVQR